MGTVVTLSEPSPPSVSGVAWGTPTFVVNGVESSGSVQITIGEQTTTGVVLRNIANTAPLETTPPTTTPAPTTTPTPTTTSPSSPSTSAPASSSAPAVTSAPASSGAPVQSISGPRTPSPVLASTGADAAGLGQIAIALIAAGVLAVAGGRRRKA